VSGIGQMIVSGSGERRGVRPVGGVFRVGHVGAVHFSALRVNRTVGLVGTEIQIDLVADHHVLLTAEPLDALDD
jgi:hypothetical protein